MKKCNDCGKELPDDSVFCQYCGSRNIIDPSKTPFKRCVDCGQKLPIDSQFCMYCGSKRIALVNGTATTRPVKTTAPAPTKKKTSPLYIILACVAVLAVIGLSILGSDNPDFENGKVITNENISDKYGQYYLDLSAPRNYNMYVCLHDVNKDTILTCMVEKNNTVSILLRPGDYEMYYALGTEWYGEIIKFGSETIYYKDKLTYNTSHYYIGYCYQRNLKTDTQFLNEINGNEFPN